MTRRRWWLLAASIAVLSLVASANGIRNGFTFDDRYIVYANEHVHTLHGWWRAFAHTYWPEKWGGDGYRPLTILGFAAQWTVGHGAPWVFHLVNVLAYCATSIAVFWLASLLLPEAAAWLAAALFAVHPVHVEAVANVVGQSEILVALYLVLATALYIRARQRGSLTPRTIAGIAALYVVACFTKEHGIVLPALLVLAEATVIRDERPVMRRLLVALRPFWLGLAALGFAFLLARSRVMTGEYGGFQPFIVFETLQLSYVNRVLTMFGVVPDWVRLLLWPARLSSEYAPPYVDIAQGPELVQLPGFLLLLGVIGIAVVAWKRKPLVTFSVGWIAVTLLPASNFILPAGFVIAERTLFLPSVGAMILVASALPWLRTMLADNRRRLATAAAAIGAVLLLGAWRSYDRNRAWYSNETLFKQAVQDSPLMYRTHYMLGTWYFQHGDKREGEVQYRTALKLFPYDPFLSYELAEEYRRAGVCPLALPLYQWSYAVSDKFHQGYSAYAYCLLVTGRFDDAKQQALLGLREGGGKSKELRDLVRAADEAMRKTGRRTLAADTLANGMTVKQAAKTQ